MTLQIAIIDDMESDCKRIEDCIDYYFRERRNISIHVTRYSCSELFLKDYLKGTFQIVFLDICMGEINGLELAKRLRTGDKDIDIIFMSSTRDFVFDTFPVRPNGYLCKPFEYAAFAEIMDMTIQGMSKKERMITLLLPRNEIVIPTSEIISITSNNHHSEVLVLSGTAYSCKMLFSEFENALENEPNFMVCNRGIMVNLDYAVKVKDGAIVMQNGTEYPIRQRENKSITAAFTKYTAERMKRSFIL